MTKQSTWGTGLALLAVLVVGLGNAWGQARGAGQAYVTPSVLEALQRPAAKGQAVPRVEIIVTFRAARGLKGEAASADIAQRRDALLDALKTLPPTSFSVTRSFVRLPGMAMEVDRAALEVLRRHPGVLAINENAPLRPFLTQSNPLTGVTGATSARSLGFTGKNVRALIIDSGISLTATAATPALGDDLLGHRCFRQDNNCPNAGDDSATTLLFSHGTHVAGVLTGPNGVAPDAKFFAAKVLDNNLNSQGGPDRLGNVLAALDFALVDPDGFGFDLINMSLGAGTDGTSRAQCDQDNTLLVAAAAQLNAQGVTLFAAAGNGGRINLVGSPACVTGVIAVGASLDVAHNNDVLFSGGPGCVDSRDGSPPVPNVADRVACFSDTHPSQGADRLIDLYAPGTLITSVGKDGGAFTAEGTSFSTPYAAGVAALVIEAAAGQGQNLTPTQIESVLRSTGVPLADFRNSLVAAVPRVNALAAVQSAGAPVSTTIFRSGFEGGEAAPTPPTPLARFTFAMSASVANSNGNGTTGDAGDTITFTYSFTNSGEAALSGIAVTSNLLPSLNCTRASLAVGATGACTPSNNVYTITASDVSAGTVQATATATATAVGAPAPNPVSDTDAITVSAPPPVNGQGKSGLGTNLESVEDFAVAYPFADFFKQSRPWFPASQTVFNTAEGNPAQQTALDARLDADGWVQSLPACSGDPQQFCRARTVINAGQVDWPNGDYVVRFEGSGTITYSGAAAKNNAASTPGRDVVAVNSDAIWILTVESTAAAPNHIRNIRILPPGIPETNTPRFHPDFLAKLAPYRAVRFMDWMRTNGGGFGGAPNPQVNFTDRALPADAHWTREAGVPLEVMVELSNLLDVEPWFTLPHLVNDAYVQSFATLVRDQYESGRVVYVEHSNEVWNNFPQGCGGFDCNNPGVGSLQQRGNALFGSQASPFERRLNAHGLRTRQICDIFRSVFGPRAAWIECSYGAQAANPFVATQTVDCPLAVTAGMVQGACARPGDAIAIAPYFSTYVGEAPNENEVALWNLNQLFAEIQTGGQLTESHVFNPLGPPPPAVNPCTFTFPQDTTSPCDFSSQQEAVRFTASHRGPAQQRQLALISYEGGQHLAGVGAAAGNQAITNLFVAANLDPRMGTAYTQYLSGWKDNGGEVFMHFNLSFRYGRFGSWGAMQSLTEAPNPKQQAIGNFVANNPCWWPGCGGSTPPPPPPPPSPPACNGELLLDGGLEATDFANPNAPVNAAWGSTSTEFGSVLCKVGICPDDSGTAVPRGGTVWAWFGGVSAAETATLRQSVTIPAGTNTLSFFLRRSFVSSPLNAVLRLRVDGQEVTAFLEPDTAEGAYVQRTVDLTAFANGQTHQIEFQFINPAGSGKSSFIVDDISLTCTP